MTHYLHALFELELPELDDFIRALIALRNESRRICARWTDLRVLCNFVIFQVQQRNWNRHFTGCEKLDHGTQSGRGRRECSNSLRTFSNEYWTGPS